MTHQDLADVGRAICIAQDGGPKGPAEPVLVGWEALVVVGEPSPQLVNAKATGGRYALAALIREDGIVPEGLAPNSEHYGIVRVNGPPWRMRVGMTRGTDHSAVGNEADVYW